MTSLCSPKFAINTKKRSAKETSFRRKRFQRFRQLLGVSRADKILDVGGLSHTWEGTGLETSVTILNTSPPSSSLSAIRWIEGDACDMSGFRDGEFDVIFSNSVIEHVGSMDRQREMANEIRRIGRRYWVQTPHKHFPLEIHFLFPFFQYLPRPMQVGVGKYWPLSYSKRLGLDPVYELDHIWLLDRKEVSGLFPDANILVERVVGLPKSIIAARY